MAVVIRNGSVKIVKNLGWLLRHLGDVKEMHLFKMADGGALLVAHLDDPQGPWRYEIRYASYEIARRFLKRPGLRGIPLRVVGPTGGAPQDTTCDA